MPWAAVNAAIDTSFNYTASEAAVSNFISKTGHDWKNSENSLTKKIQCPRCVQELNIPWTTCCQSEKTSTKE
jgi:hypothetical protein